MAKHKLCCIDLRAHLCDPARKNTQLCMSCAQPCMAGMEYKGRFLDNRLVKAEQQALTLEKITEAYVAHRQKKYRRLSEALEIVKPVGIDTTRKLRDAWTANLESMLALAKEKGWEIPMHHAMGRLSLDQRLVYYRQRIAMYNEMLDRGEDWTAIGKADGGIEPSAARMRYKAAKKAIEENDELCSAVWLARSVRMAGGACAPVHGGHHKRHDGRACREEAKRQGCCQRHAGAGTCGARPWGNRPGRCKRTVGC